MIWSHDSLWQKAKQYIERAFAADRESPLFPFWASLSLEFLARACLAKVHPALLADPDKPENLLFAFEIGATDKPKSIAITTVYLRCRLIAPEFTDDLAKACTTLTERRNAELHSGDTSFDGLPTSAWLAQFYKACQVLLRAQGFELGDWIPEAEDVRAAEEMIQALEQKHRDEALKRIGEAKGAFQKLPPDDQTSRHEDAEVEAKLARGQGVKIIECPACGSKAVLRGGRIRATPPVLKDDMLYWESIYLPKSLECGGCGLELPGYAVLHGAGLGGQYVEESYAEPSQYYSPAEEYFEEYNNM